MMETHLTPTLYYLPCPTSHRLLLLPGINSQTNQDLPLGEPSPRQRLSQHLWHFCVAWKWWSNSVQKTRGLHAHPTHLSATDAHFMNCHLLLQTIIPTSTGKTYKIHPLSWHLFVPRYSITCKLQVGGHHFYLKSVQNAPLGYWVHVTIF